MKIQKCSIKFKTFLGLSLPCPFFRDAILGRGEFMDMRRLSKKTDLDIRGGLVLMSRENFKTSDICVC